MFFWYVIVAFSFLVTSETITRLFLEWSLLIDHDEGQHVYKLWYEHIYIYFAEIEKILKAW